MGFFCPPNSPYLITSVCQSLYLPVPYLESYLFFPPCINDQFSFYKHGDCKVVLQEVTDLPSDATIVSCDVKEVCNGASVRRGSVLKRCRGGRKVLNKRWVCKRSGNPNGVSSQFEFGPTHEQEEQRTTVMIKNIPNKYSREMFIKFLDDHCKEVNDKAKLENPSEPSISAYDFLYLPMDFRNKCNLGYAFVNFTTPNGASKLYNTYENYAWRKFMSKKVCRICYARIQGKEALELHFKKSTFRCDSDEFLPIVFESARDGSCCDHSFRTIGRLVKP
ncbi:hypothetical protein QJS10_CPB11g01188 [Acorus calamus]|uniref:Mei2-like C-terminal RNA recognition motif domain-containing protein n=1 Tax=Acorus calamus TaxID=4465 RepID=A0AAV9DRZ3_ACOCL|nr:hypothetical protein QJS10_CPB11g01188 [Acorus calamus]